jgi:heme-degrading monooxygenase HmoA
MEPLANTPPPPYYAVVFTSVRGTEDGPGYGAMAGQMVELASRQPGFLGVESVRGPDGVGITVSYWDSREAIERWGRHAERLLAQRLGRERWYDGFRLRVCRVESEQVFPAGQEENATPATGESLASGDLP